MPTNDAPLGELLARLERDRRVDARALDRLDCLVLLLVELWLKEERRMRGGEPAVRLADFGAKPFKYCTGEWLNLFCVELFSKAEVERGPDLTHAESWITFRKLWHVRLLKPREGKTYVTLTKVARENLAAFHKARRDDRWLDDFLDDFPRGDS